MLMESLTASKAKTQLAGKKNLCFMFEKRSSESLRRGDVTPSLYAESLLPGR